MTLATAAKQFYDGAKEGWHNEREAIKLVSGVAILPIIGAIAGYKYLTETTGEANPVFAIVAVAGVICSPLALLTVPMGIVADAVLLSSCPFYMFYKGCTGPTTRSPLTTSARSTINQEPEKSPILA